MYFVKSFQISLLCTWDRVNYHQESIFPKIVLCLNMPKKKKTVRVRLDVEPSLATESCWTGFLRGEHYSPSYSACREPLNLAPNLFKKIPQIRPQYQSRSEWTFKKKWSLRAVKWTLVQWVKLIATKSDNPRTHVMEGKNQLLEIDAIKTFNKINITLCHVWRLLEVNKLATNG